MGEGLGALHPDLRDVVIQQVPDCTLGEARLLSNETWDLDSRCLVDASPPLLDQDPEVSVELVLAPTLGSRAHDDTVTPGHQGLQR